MMALEWFVAIQFVKKHAPTGKNRRNRLGRTTGFEALEHRALLSVSLGLAPSAVTGSKTAAAALISTATAQTQVTKTSTGTSSTGTSPTAGTPGQVSTAAAATLGVRVLPPGPAPAGIPPEQKP